MEKSKEAYLVQKISEGDERAFKDIFLLYYDPLCNFCWSFTKSGTVSEDLVQEIFSIVWHNRKNLDPKRSVRLYLYQAVKNKALDYLEHQNIVRQYEADQQSEYLPFEKQESYQADNEQFVKAARAAIFSLPHRTQQIYILSREDGFTYPEIAEIMEVSVKTVEAHISKALDILRDRLRNSFPDHVTDRTIAKIFNFRSTGTR